MQDSEFLTARAGQCLPDDDAPILEYGPARAARDSGRRRAEQPRHWREQVARLEAANAALAHLAADAAHDLRSPLQVVAGAAESLAAGCGGTPDEATQALVARILGATGDMARLLEAALSQADTTPGGRPEPVDCNEVMRTVIGRLGVLIEQTGASIEVGQLPLIPCRPVPLSRVLQNLLANACRAARPGRAPSIVVSGRRTLQGYELRVTDDGVGVAPGLRSRIFAYHARGEHTAPDGGRGRGLAICERIVRQHGGRIWVEQPLAGGSSFVVHIPDPA